ncbi:hypothetical protein [uncultured Rubinisphaera sp.]|uniref:hypothetical protein n=1 Tax=uncultured Rubinisphaera sp. TaxID=1678686 RepID=UPI0030D7596E
MNGIQNQHSSSVRFVIGCGLFLILIGCFHVFVFLVDGGSWSGSISWRKPILFGISTGVTLLSLSWVAGLLQAKKHDLYSFRLIGIFLVIEVLLITVQTWRSEPSHFNTNSALNSSIQFSTELLVTISVIVIADLTFRSFGRLTVPADMKLAVRGGMSLLLAGCLIGFLILGIGYHQLSIDRAPETYGTRGVLKYPHGIPLHAIQILPLISWLSERFGHETRTRTMLVQTGLAFVIAFTGFGLLQTFTGHSRFESWAGLYLYWGSCIVIIGLWLVSTWRHLMSQNVPSSAVCDVE